MLGSLKFASLPGDTSAATSAAEAVEDALRAQLDRVLADPLFANSSRYPRLLRYVVEQTLAGRVADLKERTIGTVVFHKEPAYDTNVDHVVRNVAVEVRKRLSQFYQQPGHETEIRIELPAGSYVPRFHVAAEELPADAGVLESPGTQHPVEPAVRPARLSRTRHRAIWWGVAVAAGVALGIGGVSLWPTLHQSALDRFWAPVWNAPGPLVICVDGLGDALGERAATVNASPTLADLGRTFDLVRFSDALTLARLAELAGARGKPLRTISGRGATYSDLHSSSVILIGSGDSEWVSQVSNWLPYHLKFDGHVAAVVNSKNANQAEYTVDLDAPYNQRVRDYAIVWRIHGRLHDSVLTGAAGLTRFGTSAAGDFLTSRQQLDDLERRLGRGWEKKNFEVLLTVTAVKGSIWPPLIVATEVWEPGSTNAFKREVAQKADHGSGAAGTDESRK